MEDIFDPVESRKESALLVLSPLGFVDAKDKKAPGDIYHPVIGRFDTQNTRAGEVVQAIYAIGVRRGEENVRQQMRSVLGL